ncbi:hypothetical protein [Treponema sp. Marseille-Q4130]|uniref:hypothetical protein n=2 Tax=Treponemataceae TaxID=2845253 RepID=UPI001651D459|nr:hypothetical protein [Treponema sp. Marseille-Q4130]MBC6720393.1 hypothetical protein [Treponema sp. Marseille-Q4130]
MVGETNTVELHYYFSDKEHKIDAFIENQCEHELLTLMKEISAYFEIDILFETGLTKEGGFRKFFHLTPNNLSEKEKKKIRIEIRISVCVVLIANIIVQPLAIPITETIKYAVSKMLEDKEIKELEKEKLKEEVKALKLDNEKRLRDIEENEKIKISRSNFYETLHNYERLDHIEFSADDESENKVVGYGKIPKSDFKKYILNKEALTDKIIENATITIVSPVLTKINKNIKWRGFYNGELITLTMKSEEFITSIDEGLIEFKKGFTITCNLRIEREKMKTGEEKRIYIVTEVISYIINEKELETLEGKRYKQLKKEKEAIQYLPFDEFPNNKIVEKNDLE